MRLRRLRAFALAPTLALVLGAWLPGVSAATDPTWGWVETLHEWNDSASGTGETLPGDNGCLMVGRSGSDFLLTPDFDACPWPGSAHAVFLDVDGDSAIFFGSPEFPVTWAFSDGEYEVELTVLDLTGLGPPRGSWRVEGVLNVGQTDTVSFVARYSDQRCATLAAVAPALGLDDAEDVVRLGVNGFRDLAAAGEAFEVDNPPANDGPCEIVVSWPSDEADSIAAAAAAWGVDEDQLHHAGGNVVLHLIWRAVHDHAA